MRKSRRLDLQKEQHWREVLLRFQQSGLPFREFCAQKEISSNTFQYWRKKLRERDEARGVNSTIRKGENRLSNDQEKLNYWLRVIDDANTYSGSVNEFCRVHSIRSSGLYYWERRLRKLGLTAGLRKSSEQTLVPVRIVENEPASTDSKPPTLVGDDQRIEIRLHDGNRVLVPASLPVELVVQMLNGLRGKKS